MIKESYSVRLTYQQVTLRIILQLLQYNENKILDY